MVPNVPLALDQLVRYLRQRQTHGDERVYLTNEARQCLRQMMLNARAGKTNQPVASPLEPVSPPPAPRSEPVAPPSKPADALDLDQENDYPSAKVASVRTVLEPRGETKAEKIAYLKELIAEDEEAHLESLRDTMVFSVGNVDADLMFVGEAPGYEEERQQEPFVGPAGQLLTKIITAMGLQRETVYISNIVKFRPGMPNQSTRNRKPEAEEMYACLPYIMAEIAIVQPKVIVALGATGAEGLTGFAEPVGRSRGQVRSWKGIPFVVTYHPSYLLRNQALSERRKVWEDMLLVMEALQMPISDKQRLFFTKGR